ncbi:hypothetical protein MY5147_005022 [Beauveria neobassiana]
MSYPPPPGTSSLPARPPPSQGGFKPAFTPSSVQKHQKTAAPTTYTSYPHRAAPGAPPSFQYGASSSSYGAAAQAAPSVSATPYSYGPSQTSGGASSSYGTQPYNQQSYGQQQSYDYAASAAPQIRNPFPQPGTAAASASAAAAAAAGGRPSQPAAAATRPVVPEMSVAQANPDKTVVRHGGGKKWTDESLLEWDPSHLRLFVGNLGGETTDDALLKAFSRWGSVQKARVIRDKRTSKSKGYGFVSFSDADDFFQAAKEMNNKYIQNRPVVVRKANTEIKVTSVKDKNRNGKNRNKSGSGGGHGQNGHDTHLGPKSAAGVVKPGQKTKNGLRLLG